MTMTEECKYKLINIIESNNKGELLLPEDFLHINLCMYDFPEESRQLYENHKK